MNNIKLQSKIFCASIIYLFINYGVSNIPCWTFRKWLYKIFGMKIGKGSRINMKCIVVEPWNIRIGDNTIINEYCYLDGRGGLDIGDNTSISIYAMIFSASHDSRSSIYNYIKQKTIIKNNVWLGARSIVLQGTIVENKCILSAGSTLKGKTESNYIYSGIPAEKRSYRNLESDYSLKYNDYFR